MDYMFQPGFLGTKAPFFMDFVTMIVAFLPLVIIFAIALAIKKSYKAHALMQWIIFLFSFVVISYFEYGVRLGGGYEYFVKNTHVSHNYLFIVLTLHIIISLITLGIWLSTLFNAWREERKGNLPGGVSYTHRKSGYRSFLGILFTSLSGIWVYLLLFAF